MATIETRVKQRCIIEFLTKEGIAPKEIHDRLGKVYQLDALSYSQVKL